MKKKPVLYVVILCLWACCLCALWFAYAKIVAGLNGYTITAKTFIIVLLTINTVALSALWLGSVKDLTFSVAYAVLRKKNRKTLRRNKGSYARRRKRSEIFAFILHLQRLQRRRPFGVQKAGLPELQDRYFRRQFEVRIYKRNKPIRRSSRRRRGYTA